MKTVTVQITCDDEFAEKAAHRLVNADRAHMALADIANELLRPARRHGYADAKIREQLEAIGDGKGEDLIGVLEERFYDILREYGVDLDDVT